jgi:hypothetical protein
LEGATASGLKTIAPASQKDQGASFAVRRRRHDAEVATKQRFLLKKTKIKWAIDRDFLLDYI